MFLSVIIISSPARASSVLYILGNLEGVIIEAALLLAFLDFLEAPSVQLFVAVGTALARLL